MIHLLSNQGFNMKLWTAFFPAVRAEDGKSTLKLIEVTLSAIDQVQRSLTLEPNPAEYSGFNSQICDAQPTPIKFNI